MNLNKKGFTLVELLATIVIMGIIMALAFPTVMGMIDSNKRKQYESFERSMTEYAKAYFEESTGTIGLSSLKQVGLTGIDEECVGYVLSNDNYKAYLKCGDDWETNGFNTNNAS